MTKENYYCSYHKCFIDEGKLLRCLTRDCTNKETKTGICKHLFLNYKKVEELNDKH